MPSSAWKKKDGRRQRASDPEKGAGPPRPVLVGAAPQGRLHRVAEAGHGDGDAPARRRAARPRRRGAAARGRLAVARPHRPLGEHARLDPADDGRRGAAGEGHFCAVAAAQPARGRDQPRLRGQPTRPCRRPGEGDLLAGTAALDRKRRLPAGALRQAHRGRPEGEGDLLAIPDGRRGERPVADGDRAERARDHRDAQEGAVLGGADGHGLGPAGGPVRPHAERGDEGAADLRLLTAPRARGARQADRDREDRAEPGAAQEGRLLARPVARPARGAGPAGDHQSVIAPLVLVLAQSLGGRVADEAIFPATIADSVTVWPALLKLARDERVARRAKRQAVFWLGQAAGDAATRGLTDLVDDSGVDREVKEQAVFALSQRPRDEGVPALIRIARTHRDPEVRRKALFWLGESDDPRALALFGELLTTP